MGVEHWLVSEEAVERALGNNGVWKGKTVEG